MSDLYKQLKKVSRKLDVNKSKIAIFALLLIFVIISAPLIGFILLYEPSDKNFKGNIIAGIFFFSIFAFPLIIAIIYRLSFNIKNDYFKFIKNKKLDENEVLQDLKYGIYRYVLILGEKYLIIFMYDAVDIYKYDEILWGYLTEENGLTITINLVDNKGKFNKLWLYKKSKESILDTICKCSDILNELLQKNNNMCIGYNKELENLVKKDINNIYTFDKSLIDKDKIKL